LERKEESEWVTRCRFFEVEAKEEEVGLQRLGMRLLAMT